MSDEIDPGYSPREEIVRLEQRLEDLAEDMERCRKLAILAKVMVAGSAAWIAAGIVGVVGFGGTTIMVTIALILAGLILGGSNRSTMEHTQAEVGKAEARRNELIGAIDLRTVQARTMTPETPVRWLH